VTDPKDIRVFYRSLKRRGLTAQSELAKQLEGSGRLPQLYRAGTRGLGPIRMTEPFYPAGSRKSLKESWPPQRTEHLAWRLWKPSRWKVDKAAGLDFFYVDREIVTARTKAPAAVTDNQRLERLDLLLCNAEDRTPILAELKIGKDENAFYAFVQGLAHLAQLQSKTQRKRLANVYPDFFPAAPEQFDLYLILFDQQTTGKRGDLRDQAEALATQLADGESIPALRRVACLEATPADDGLRLSKCFAVGPGTRRD
jgi:hypothetical protein